LGLASSLGKRHAPFWTFQELKSAPINLENMRFFFEKSHLSRLAAGFRRYKLDLVDLATEGR
jgi:hypothetical protein